MHIRIRKKRPDLRLIISSATIDAQSFLNYFNTNVDGSDRSQDDATVISLEGRMYPVEISYLAEPTLDYVQCAVEAVLKIHLHVRGAVPFVPKLSLMHCSATYWRHSRFLDW